MTDVSPRTHEPQRAESRRVPARGWRGFVTARKTAWIMAIIPLLIGIALIGAVGQSTWDRQATDDLPVGADSTIYGSAKSAPSDLSESRGYSRVRLSRANGAAKARCHEGSPSTAPIGIPSLVLSVHGSELLRNGRRRPCLCDQSRERRHRFAFDVIYRYHCSRRQLLHLRTGPGLQSVQLRQLRDRRTF